MKTIFNSAVQLKAALLDRYNKNESIKAQIIAISGI
ncbi:uridine kinase, partial [Psychromonas sp. MB-3u-54]